MRLGFPQLRGDRLLIIYLLPVFHHTHGHSIPAQWRPFTVSARSLCSEQRGINVETPSKLQRDFYGDVSFTVWLQPPAPLLVSLHLCVSKRAAGRAESRGGTEQREGCYIVDFILYQYSFTSGKGGTCQKLAEPNSIHLPLGLSPGWETGRVYGHQLVI